MDQVTDSHLLAEVRYVRQILPNVIVERYLSSIDQHSDGKPGELFRHRGYVKYGRRGDRNAVLQVRAPETTPVDHIAVLDDRDGRPGGPRSIPCREQLVNLAGRCRGRNLAPHKRDRVTATLRLGIEGADHYPISAGGLRNQRGRLGPPSRAVEFPDRLPVGIDDCYGDIDRILVGHNERELASFKINAILMEFTAPNLALDRRTQFEPGDLALSQRLLRR